MLETMKKFLFDELYSRGSLERMTRSYYERSLVSSDIEADFKKVFDVSYRLVFGIRDTAETMDFLLGKYYRNERFAKNLVRKTFPAMRFREEVPLEDKRADMVGYPADASPVCFEIKTKYDTLDRLPAQIAVYVRHFPKTYVVCSTDKVAGVITIVPSQVGIFSYADRSNAVLRRIRPAR